MIKKLDDTAPRISRQQLADPSVGTPYLERLKQAGAVDLRDNAVVELADDGYMAVRPIDPARRFGK